MCLITASALFFGFSLSQKVVQILTNSTAKLSPGALNRGDVLTACFHDIQSQRSILVEFVIIMILFDVKDSRLLYGSISLSPHSERTHTRQSRFCKCSSVDVFGTKARMHTCRI